jgi:hypothetical protein
MTRITALCALLVAGVVHAESGPAIDFRDLPGTDGEWQEATAIIAAPAGQVRRWLVDYPNWPVLFDDVEHAQVLGSEPDGAAVVRFRSRIAGRTIVLREWQTHFGLVYRGEAPNVRTQGRIYLLDLGNGRTRVIMQSTAQVHGFWRPFATKRLKRNRAFEIMRSNLESLHDLSEGAYR